MGEACAALEQRRVGALVVCDGERVAGVFSERDVVRALAAEGAAALDRPVAEYMTAKVIFAEPKEEMSALMSRMTDRRVRHLPVLEAERLVGVISIGDVVEMPDRRTRPGSRQPALLYRQLKPKRGGWRVTV